MKTSHLKLQGLMCGGCGEIIERAVQKVAGVDKCTVNLGTKQATIQYDPQLVALESIQKALAGVGYPAQLLDETVKSTQ